MYLIPEYLTDLSHHFYKKNCLQRPLMRDQHTLDSAPYTELASI